MTENKRWDPHLTVATVVEDQGRFLLVEETVGGKPVFNQPAGHVDPFESLKDAAIRETLEETGWEIELTAWQGLYVYFSPRNGVTYYRHCFAAKAIKEQPNATLDQGIIGPQWLSFEEIQREQSRHRSPLVMQCVEDFINGKQFPLDSIWENLNN